MGNASNAASGAAFKVHSQAAARTRRRGPQHYGAVTVTHLHPMAEELALYLAHGNRNRFIVISATTVIVVNRPRGGTR